ncbi:MAG TPA: hydroxyethylthiazole kinase [Clostridiales bacterium]|nr:hydroxyethylthiazole kinase [Clostridiales bacterium]
MLKEMLLKVKENKPLIHNITNYVTVNDCANILLGCGASPIMADDIDEAAEITSLCGGLTINIGTLNQHTIPAMFAAGKKANELGHPIVLDPVGAGASKLRTETAFRLLKEVKPTVIRGNISEIKTIAMGRGTTKGVDADAADAVTGATLAQTVALAKNLALETGAIIVITGAIDTVSDGKKTFCVFNGHPLMSEITGTGCQLSCLIAAYLTANPGSPLTATVAAVCAMGLCGEKAFERLTDLDGNASYRNYILDAIYRLTGDDLESGGKYELR